MGLMDNPSWDAHDADPIVDLRAVQESVYENMGYHPTTIYMSSQMLDMYKWVLARNKMLEDLLKRTTRRNLVQRYVLRRLMGQPRMKIIAPRIDRTVTRIKYRWHDWKHRNDPYYGY